MINISIIEIRENALPVFCKMEDLGDASNINDEQADYGCCHATVGMGSWL